MSASRAASGGSPRSQRLGERDAPDGKRARKQDPLLVRHQRFQRSAAQVEQGDAAASRQVQRLASAQVDQPRLFVRRHRPQLDAGLLRAALRTRRRSGRANRLRRDRDDSFGRVGVGEPAKLASAARPREKAVVRDDTRPQGLLADAHDLLRAIDDPVRSGRLDLRHDQVEGVRSCIEAAIFTNAQ